MAGIKNCIAKFKDFPESLKNKLISLSDRFKSEGKEDLQADTEAILAVHKELHDELNDLKRQVKEPIKKYNRPDVKKQVEAVQEKHKKEDEEAAKLAEEKAKKEAEIKKLVETGDVIFPQEGMDENDYYEEIANFSQNAAQVAAAYINAGATNTNKDTANYGQVYDFFKTNQLSKAAFLRIFGENAIKDYPQAYKSYATPTGGVSENYGEIAGWPQATMNAIEEFVLTYPEGISGYEEQFKTTSKFKLANKFKQLTGRNLTENLANELAPRHYEYMEEAERKAAFDVEEELAKEGAREKAFAETGQFQKKKSNFLSEIRKIDLKAEGIDGVILTEKESVEFQKKVDEVDSDAKNLFQKDDIRKNLFNYDEPILQKTVGKFDIRIAHGYVKDKKKTYLLYVNGSVVAELNSLEDAKSLVKLAEEAIKTPTAFQKKTEPTKAQKAVIDKVMERMKKALPKFNIVYNSKLDAAGKIEGNKIEINPLYADIDTPIHEVGHALIDFIGYKNRVIQAGIKQLRDTQFYKDVAAARPELTGELLDKEVLAEAIGKEGAGIFDKEVAKSRFKQVLDYIFTKLKQLLGIDKNIAKSLAKQIIGGIGTKDITEVKDEAFQKKDGEKKAKKEPLSPEAQKIKDLYDAIKDIEDVSTVPYEDLLSAYNYAITNEEFRKSSGATKAKDEFVERIGANFYQRNYDKAKSDPKFDPMKAAKTDISGKDILFKALSHFTSNHPELKGLKELYDKAVFKRITETTEKQNTNRKLAIEVIKDRNKSLGIVGRVKENVLNLIFGNRNFKYFDYLEGKDGKFITVDEAKKKKLSEAQINYLKFVRNTVAAKAGVIDNLKDNWNSEMEVLRADKKFYESATTENAVAAVSHLLGNTWNISNVRIDFINPNTGKEQTADYGEIERIFTKYGNESPVKKAKSVASIIKYNVKARKQLKTGTNIDEAANPLNMVKRGDYVLTKEGKLISRFDRKRSETRSYSKDFYSAINEYIADTEHIQHMQPLIPIIHGIDNLNRLGLYERDENGEISKTIHGQKPNLVKWLNEWSNMHIYKNPKETIPELDVALRFFRNVASMTMMLFNTTAQARNAIMGVVNAFIKENGATIKDGMSRLFGSAQRKINSDYAYGLVNPYALELIKKFKAVSTDIDSNPIRSAGGFLTSLGFAGTKWGEFLVQGSQWLGTMSKEDYNSFTWKKNKFGGDELVFKESIPKEKQEEIEARLLDLVNKVSDVQGKYSEKDRRNIQNSEWGKSIMQYRVWLPDWWRVRFSKDAGHWRNMMGGEIWELRKNLAKAAVDKGYAKAIWQDKNMMSALKELMLITGLFALMYQDDDDEEKSFASKQAMKMLSEMVGVVDPENVKQIIERPIPSMGVVTKFLDAADHLIMLEADDFYSKDGKYGKKGDSKLKGDIRGNLPGKQLIDAAEEAIEDEGEK